MSVRGRGEIVDPGAKQRPSLRDRDRRKMVLGLDVLRAWLRSSDQTLATFIIQNRHEIDAAIGRLISR